MSKLDELMKSSRAVAAESMGAGRQSGMMHRASAPQNAPTTPAKLHGITRAKDAAEIPLDKIAPDPDQPREDFDEEALVRLSQSLKSRGQLQPIRVRWDEPAGLYRIIMGERRWRAARMAGLATMACVITEGEITPGDLLAIQIIENCLREDLQPIEQAKAFRTLMERHQWSQRRLADELGIAQSNVVRALALLDLPASVQDQVEQGALPAATAYEVSKLKAPEDQVEVAARVVAENLSRAETVEVVREAAERAPRVNPGAKGRGGKASSPKPRIFRGAKGKIIVELKRAGSLSEIAELLAEITEQVRTAIGEQGMAGSQGGSLSQISA